MKILQLISTLGFFGAENVLLEVSKGIRELGQEVYIGAIVNKAPQSLDIVKRADQEGFKTVTFISDDKFSINNLMLLREFIKTHSVDIVHAHNYKSNFFGLISTLGLSVRRVSTCHNWPGTSLKMDAYKYLDMLQLRFYDKIVAVSDTIKGELHRWGISQRKTLLVLNGIDVRRFSSSDDIGWIRSQLGILPEEKVIGTVGRIEKGKGHEQMLKASKSILASYPKTRFLVVGDGPFLNDLKGKTSGLPFIFTGIRKDVENMYSAMDVFVLPSMNEGLPMVLLEAMCSGKPVIVSRVGEIPNVVDDGIDGVLIEPGSEEQLSDAVVFLLGDRDRAEKFAFKGKDKILKSFSTERMAREYLNIYYRLFTEKEIVQ